MRLDAAVAAVLDHPHRQVERTEITEEGGHAHDFAGGVGKRLALFAGQQPCQFAHIGFDGLGHFRHELPIGVAAHAGKAALAAATAASS
jgi:hypothetical protein